MDILFKLIIIPAFAFCVLSWAADNPAKVSTLRDKIVKQFERGVEAAAKELNSMAK